MKEVLLARFKSALDTDNSPEFAVFIEEMRTYVYTIWDKAIIFEALIYCIQQKNDSRINQVLQLWKSCPQPQNDGASKQQVMIEAIMKNHQFALDALINEWGSSKQDYEDWQFQTAVHAIKMNDSISLEKIINKWPINIDKLLKESVSFGDVSIDCTRLLVNRNPNSKTLSDLDLFINCAATGQIQAIKLLSIDTVSSVKKELLESLGRRSKHTPSSYQTYTALYIAAANGHIEIVRYLLSQNAAINTGLSCYHYGYYRPGGRGGSILVNDYYQFSSTDPTAIATKNNHSQIARLLLAANTVHLIFFNHSTAADINKLQSIPIDDVAESLQILFSKRINCNRTIGIFSVLQRIQYIKDVAYRQQLEMIAARLFYKIDKRALVFIARHAEKMSDLSPQVSKILSEASLSDADNQSLINAKVSFMSLQLDESYLKLNFSAIMNIYSKLSSDTAKYFFSEFVQCSYQDQIKTYAQIHKIDLQTLKPINQMERFTIATRLFVESSSDSLRLFIHQFQLLMNALAKPDMLTPHDDKEKKSSIEQHKVSSETINSTSVSTSAQQPLPLKDKEATSASAINEKQSAQSVDQPDRASSYSSDQSLSQAQLLSILGRLPSAPNSLPVVDEETKTAVAEY